MKHIVNLRVEKSPEGVYLATSDDMPGLVAEGCTIAETIEIARDIARGLVEAQAEDAVQIALASTDGKAHGQRVTECYF
jgi:predicted RNase H-like HicB family nuclease